MKKIILLISITTYSICVVAQDYIPLVKEGASWLIFSQDDVGENADEYWNFIIKEDTLINSQQYNKVILRKLEPIQNSDTYELLDETLFALLREEIENRKVYCIKLQDYKWGMEYCEINEEFLLYDFSYSIGDEIISCNTIPSPEMPIVIHDIQQEFLYNETRTVLDYAGFENWIEGVGHSSGLFTRTTNLNQVANTSVVILEYCNNLNQCDIILDNKDLPIENDFRIYPNPVNSIIYLDNNLNKIQSIQIFDSRGHLILDKETSDIEINVDILKPGMYFMNINMEKAPSQSIKFLKI